MKTKEFREQLAQQFVDALEEKGLEWKAGWSNYGNDAMFINATNNRPYSGINTFALFLATLKNHYKDRRWCTFNQIVDREGTLHPGETWKLKKGSKGVQIEYWFPFDKKTHKFLKWSEYHDLLMKIASEEKDFHDRFIICAKYYVVFNGDCIEGLPEPTKGMEKREMNDLVLKTAKNMGVEIITDDVGRCYYNRLKDMIHLPKPEYFLSDYDLTSTAFHELSHATGALGRLGRPSLLNSQGYGSKEYCYEELVAEISSVFMAADAGAGMTKEHMESHQAYVNGWIEDIKDNPNVLFNAIKDATAAANYLNWKAELITDKEYEATLQNVKVESVRNTGDDSLEKLCKEAAEFIDYNREETYTLDDFHRDFPDLHNVDLVKTTDPASGKELIVSFDLIDHSYSRYLDRELVDTKTFQTEEDFSLVLKSAVPEDFMDLGNIKIKDIEAQKARLLAL